MNPASPPLEQFKDKDVIFIGRGREGLSFETFIRKHGDIASFRFADQQDDPEYLLKLSSLDKARTVVLKSAGVPGRLVPVPYTTPTNVFFELTRHSGATLIGITGTKGKSTVSSLVHHILKGAGKHAILCGNIGKPMIDYLDDAKAGTIYVLELGAYQTADLTSSPHIGYINNLYHEHLDYFGDIDKYFEAKHRMISYMTEEDTYVYNPDFELLTDWAQDVAGRTIAVDWDELERIDLQRTKLIGQHNRRNILAAITITRLLGVDDETALDALETFEPLQHRLQVVGNINDVIYIDDAISTTPESALAAMEAVDSIGCMFLGGYDRDYDFRLLARQLAERAIPALVFFPPSGQRIKDLLPESYKPNILETEDMDEAVRFAAGNAPKHSTVLLSTASPSYGIWKDFEAKGEAFQSAVKDLGKQSPLHS